MSSCVLIGHRDCPCEITTKLSTIIEDLIVDYGIKTFFVGTQGDFDRYVYRILSELESKYNIEIIVVLAYLNSKRNIYYDTEKTIFPESLCNVNKRFAIYHRNLYMINKSQYMICYANNTFSNTYKYIQIAKRKGIKIFNIGELEIQSPD